MVYDEEVRLGEPAQERTAGSPSSTTAGCRSASTSRCGSRRPSTPAAPSTSKPLLDSIEEVLGALKKAGIDAFPAYGTLLGAVREGRLIGHDSDADLGYVSDHTHPVDVVRESFRLQRALADMGYRHLPLQRRRVQGRRGRGRRVGPRPRRLRRLPGGRQPAPDGRDPHAVPARVDLPAGHHHARGPRAAGPGEHRRVPRRDVRPRLAGARPGVQVRDAGVARTAGSTAGSAAPASSARTGTAPTPGCPSEPPAVEPSDFATVGAWRRRAACPERVVDIGCGRGVDDLWFARQGASVLGLDYAIRGSLAGRRARRRARTSTWSSGR